MSTIKKVFFALIFLFLILLLFGPINNIMSDNVTGFAAMITNATATSPYASFEQALMYNWHYILWGIAIVCLIWVMFKET